MKIMKTNRKDRQKTVTWRLFAVDVILRKSHEVVECILRGPQGWSRGPKGLLGAHRAPPRACKDPQGDLCKVSFIFPNR